MSFFWKKFSEKFLFSLIYLPNDEKRIYSGQNLLKNADCFIFLVWVFWKSALENLHERKYESRGEKSENNESWLFLGDKFFRQYIYSENTLMSVGGGGCISQVATLQVSSNVWFFQSLTNQQFPLTFSVHFLCLVWTNHKKWQRNILISFPYGK